jgi:hypothetical protein
MPAIMKVHDENIGCAYGQAYGCVTGGGVVDNYPSGFSGSVFIPPVKTPGISGSPPPPKKVIDEFDFTDMVDQAFSAAVDWAGDLCKSPCCCDEIRIFVQCVFGSDDLLPPEGNNPTMCVKSLVITCPKP